ncbi:MAG: TonB-dependent receptor domain-containing protein, partial [Vulcanimicrobiaceae bacterium]
MIRRLPRHLRVITAVRFAVALFVGSSLILSTAVPSFAAGGQFGNLNGTVVDQQTKAPISGATVTVASPSGTHTATTGSNGFFSLLNLPVDTYVVTIEAKGYEPIELRGITIEGDQNQNLGSLAVVQSLKTIARVTSRSQAGAFQPKQTQDSYTINADRIAESGGRPSQTNENNLVLAAPGVTLSYTGFPTIRGGRLTEVGYQLDGVPFDEPFLSGNGSFGLVNGVGSVQVVEGSGDASQGMVGSGVINVVPKRGTSPGFGYVQGGLGGPNYYHQFATEFGTAFDHNNISEYFAYNGERFQPYRATPAAAYGNFFANSYQRNDQFLNNLIFKFGHNKNQSLQLLYSAGSVQQTGNLGGTNFGAYSATNPNGLAYYPFYPPATFGLGNALPNYSSTIGLTPYTPVANVLPAGPQQNASIQTQFLKFEYDNNLDQNTALALRYYNWSQFQYSDSSYSLGTINGNIPVYQVVGGPTTGVSLDLTRQVGTKLTVTANGLYEVAHPIWNAFEPTLSPLATEIINPALDADAANGPQWSDFQPGGYLSQFAAQLPQGPGRFPTFGIDFHGAFFQQYGAGLRFQYNPTTPLKLDFGVRYEGQNQHWSNPFNPNNAGGNPFDVPAAQWTSQILNPTEVEPRAAVSYQLGRNDAIRASYGRSSVFSNAQDAGTPLGLYGFNQGLLNVPAKPGFSCGTSLGATFPCQNYAQQFYWALDRHLD